uniref:Uncharacterized protein n=1 Tax=Cacopsylla melanoneura TaxID=428564 RepID=A0A8D8QIU7_9HEMI
MKVIMKKIEHFTEENVALNVFIEISTNNGVIATTKKMTLYGNLLNLFLEKMNCRNKMGLEPNLKQHEDYLILKTQKVVKILSPGNKYLMENIQYELYEDKENYCIPLNVQYELCEDEETYCIPLKFSLDIFSPLFLRKSLFFL